MSMAGGRYNEKNRPRIFHEYSNEWRNIRAHWHRTPVQVFVVVFVDGLGSHGAGRVCPLDAREKSGCGDRVRVSGFPLTAHRGLRHEGLPWHNPPL